MLLLDGIEDPKAAELQTETENCDLEAAFNSPVDIIGTVARNMDMSQSCPSPPEAFQHSPSPSSTSTDPREQEVFQLDNEEKDPWGIPESQWTTVKLNFVDPFACEIKSYKCQCCRLVVGHHRAIKAAHNKDHICEICGKPFATRQKLCRHMLRHREKKITCEYCPKKFHTKAECRNHSVRHLAPPRPFKCNLCSRDFWTAGNFFMHVRNYHTTEMTCTSCIRVSVIQYTSFQYNPCISNSNNI